MILGIAAIPYSTVIRPDISATFVEVQNIIPDMEPSIIDNRESSIIAFSTPHKKETTVISALPEKPHIAPIPLQSEPIENTPQEIIKEKAEKYNVSHPLALALATFESNLNPTAKNKNSSATGIYQFISKTWKDYCEGEVTEAEANIECAMKLLSDKQIQHWTADPQTRLMLLQQGFIACENFNENKCKLR